jgi:hypothetical protein
MKNRIRLELTLRQWDLITTALYEYSYICEGESENHDGSHVKGLYNLSKDLTRCSSELYKQRDRLNKRSKK